MMLTPIILSRSEIFSHMEMRPGACWPHPGSLSGAERFRNPPDPRWSQEVYLSAVDDMAALLWLFKINDLSFLVFPTDLFVSVCPCPAPKLFCLLIPPPGSMGLLPLTGFTRIHFPALSRYLSYLQNENPGILLPCPGHRCHHRWHGAPNMVSGSPCKIVKLK